jgi:hypothetical protein
VQQQPWQQWARQTAGIMHGILSTYPGTARRLALWTTGPTVNTGPAVLLYRTMVRVLRQGGFGEVSPEAARLILQTACLHTALQDDRRAHSRRVPPQDRVMWDPALDGLPAYAYAIDCCLDGLAARRQPPETR